MYVTQSSHLQYAKRAFKYLKYMYHICNMQSEFLNA